MEGTSRGVADTDWQQVAKEAYDREVEEWNELIGREFFRGMRNGAVMGFAGGFALAVVLLLVLGGS